MGRTFRYALDPLCLASCALYAANRWLVKPLVASEFLRGHFNDLLLIPCALPLVLWAQRLLGLRASDDAPTVREVALHLVVWTLIAECIGPHWMHRGVADAWDAAAYALGAAFALIVWTRPARRACAVPSR